MTIIEHEKEMSRGWRAWVATGGQLGTISAQSTAFIAGWQAAANHAASNPRRFEAGYRRPGVYLKADYFPLSPNITVREESPTDLARAALARRRAERLARYHAMKGQQ